MKPSFSLLLAALAVSVEFAFATLKLRRSILPSGPGNSFPLLDAEIDIILRNPETSNNLPDAPIYSSRRAKQSTQGRPAVEAAVKAIQRFTLQLDRSDGRPDLATTVVASKFDDFVSTCLRTPGAAWTAVIGPLDYLGVKMASFRNINMEVSPPALTVDVNRISKEVAIRLLDMPANDAERSKVLLSSDADRCALWSLSMMVSQVAVRFALLENELEGVPPPASTPSLRVLCGASDSESSDEKGSTCPPDYIVESLLSLDLCMDEYSVDSTAKCFTVPAKAVDAWVKKNTLSG